MNARSLARHYAMLACGGELEGERLPSEDRVASLYQLFSDEPDAIGTAAPPDSGVTSAIDCVHDQR